MLLRVLVCVTRDDLSFKDFILLLLRGHQNYFPFVYILEFWNLK